MQDPRPVAPPSPPPPAEATAVLIERIRSGDGRALEQLCERYRPRLRRWATGRLPRSARGALDTDDIVQDALVKVLRRIREFEPRHEGALQVYMRQAILNRIRDEARKIAVRPGQSALDSQQPLPGPSPLEEAVGHELVERYEAALHRLKPEEQEAIVLRVEFEYSYLEVAEALDKPSPDAARMVVSRALVRLAAEMRAGAGRDEA